MQTSRTFKRCAFGLVSGLFLAGLVELAIGIASGGSRSALGSCGFLLALIVGCAAAALINLGALKLLGKLTSGRKPSPPSPSEHEHAP